MVHDTIVNTINFNNPVQLPSLSQINRMDQLRQKAIEDLEISDNKAHCQKCGLAVPLGEKLRTTSSTTGRITFLKRRIEWMRNHGYDIDNSTKDELEQLIKEEDKQDLLKLRLYSSKITHYRFYCSACFEDAYERRNTKRKNKV